MSSSRGSAGPAPGRGPSEKARSVRQAGRSGQAVSGTSDLGDERRRAPEMRRGASPVRPCTPQAPSPALSKKEDTAGVAATTRQVAQHARVPKSAECRVPPRGTPKRTWTGRLHISKVCANLITLPGWPCSSLRFLCKTALFPPVMGPVLQPRPRPIRAEARNPAIHESTRCLIMSQYETI